MKFTVDGQQRGFFEQHHAIVFEALLSQEELEKLHTAVGESTPKVAGERDLWRSSLEVRSFIDRRAWVETASSLLEEKPLRIGFDQRISFEEGDPFSSLWEGTASLNDLSSFRGILCGLFIPLSNNPTGQGLFVHPRYHLPLRDWIEPGTPCYLVVYLGLKAQYVLNRSDPCAAQMSHLGYTSGDRVSETLNPLIYR